MGAGRPPYYNSPDDLQEAIDAYFIEEKEKPTISGMAYALGFADRQSLRDYAENDKYSCVIKRAITRIESYHEKSLYNQSPTGSIFWLKSHGWKDKDPSDNPLSEYLSILKHALQPIPEAARDDKQGERKD